jgi:hypothetical protein
VRYRIDWIPRRSWQDGVEACDQKWTQTCDVITGTEVDATNLISTLEADYDRALVFRAVPLEVQPEDECGRWCTTCGGDCLTPTSEIACACRPGLASVRPSAPAVEAAS